MFSKPRIGIFPRFTQHLNIYKMKKIVLFIVILSASSAFGQKKDQLFPIFPQVSFTAANNGGGVKAEYANHFLSIEASSFKLSEGIETAINKEISFGLQVFQQNIDHTSVVYKLKFGLSQREMVNTLWTWGNENRMYPDTMNKIVFRTFLGLGFRHRDMAKRPYIPFREIGIEGEVMQDSNIISFAGINTFLIQGQKIGKKGLEIDPSFKWGVDNREIQRMSPGFFYSIGLKLRLYDYKKYYAIDILSVEYIGGDQAERQVSSTRVTLNVLGLVDFFSRKSAKTKQEECRCNKPTYTAKTFPFPVALSVGSEKTESEDEARLEGQTRPEGRYKKFTDIEITDVR